MNEIQSKKTLAPNVTQFSIHAPQIAKKREPGQFVIIRVYESGERFPITIADADPVTGTVTLIVQSIGRSTKEMECLEVGDSLLDLVGPLGRPTAIQNYGKVVCVAGGVGVAEIFPVAQALKIAGNEVISIIGARNQELLILENEMQQVSHRLIVTTDDGSYGLKGLVTVPLKEILEQEKIDHVFCIGPTIMMKAVADLTRNFAVHTSVSLNSIMVDGTGMCGACRVTVGNKMKFACVDGPDFDAHQVDFAELMQRQKSYLKEEKTSLERFQCHCGKHANS
jgi:ferredoxin--NADP+ reductase